MKFDLGHWLLLPGTQAIYPVTVTDVTVDQQALIVTGYNHHVNGRGNLTDGITITARFTSPMPNVIRVQFTHFKGRRERLPAFDLDYALSNSNVDIGCD